MKKLFIFLLVLTSAIAKAADSSFILKTTDNVSLYVKVSGKGKPCVFVHGGPGSNAYYYEAFQQGGPIENQVQMIYYDQRGCGRSSSPANGDYSLSRMEKDLEEIRQNLGFAKWAIMGHSFGGVIITSYAQHYPSRVAALLLIHCTLDVNYSMASHILSGIKILGIVDKAPYLDTTKPIMQRVGMIHDQLTEKKLWYKLMFRNQYEKDLNDTIDNPIEKHNRDFANAVWGIPEYMKDFTPLTKDIKCPVFIMAGDKDYAIGPDHYKSFAFPYKSIVIYHGGHAPFQEEPQWYAEKVIDFFKQIKY